MKKTFPLRYSLPALLLGLGGALACLLIADSIHNANQNIEAAARQQLTAIGDGAAARIEYCLASGGFGAATWPLALLNREPDLLGGSILDGNNRRLAGAGPEFNSGSAKKQTFQPDLALVNAARKYQAAQLQSGRNGHILAGAFPCRLAVSHAAANPASSGVVYLEMDLRPQQDLQLVANFRRAGMIGGLALVLVVLSWSYLNRILTQRIAGLIAATREIASGDTSRRALLGGGDELAELGAAFNQMADQIQARTTALTESEERYRRIVETAYEGIFAIDAERRLGFVNRRMAEMLGCTMDAMTGQPLEEFLFQEDWPDHQSRLGQRQFNTAARFEQRLRCKDGSEVWTIMSLTVLRDAAETFAGAFGMAADITERKRAEKKLLLQSSALMASANAIVITDADGGIEWINPAFTRLTGYPEAEIIGQKISRLRSGRHAPEFYAALWGTIRAGKTWQGELTNKRRDGSLYTEAMTIAPVCDTAGKILHYVAIKEDVTERRELESQLREAQKMEAISRLAGGVAHEFNNLFTVIMGHANLLKSSGRLAPEDATTIEEISAAGRRAAGVTRQLLIFSRQQPVHLKPIHLNQIITHQFNILKHLLGEKISIQQQLADALPAIAADAAMMEQIIMELAMRARQAMPAEGRLTLATQAVELAQAPDPAAPEARAGRFVRLTVTDTGLGLDTEEMRRIFEPFFEGPQRNQPGNLGLATVYGIVKEHHGWVEVCSRANEGTTFNIFLPVAETPAVAAGATAAPVPSLAAAETKTILLVEDDDSLRKLVGACLRQLNYQVLVAADSLEAGRLWREHPGAIDLLFTDVILPGELDGRELARRFKQERPGLKIIFTTGYSRERAGDPENISADEICLAKPYEPEMLAQVVWQALADSARVEP